MLEVLPPLLLSLKVSLFATFFSSIFAVFFACYMARKQGTLPVILDALCTLPLVLPPTVLGYYLILILGKNAFIGSWLDNFGITFMFTWQGAVIAATLVVFPLIYKSCRAALAQVDAQLENAARTLGASEFYIFLTISIPLAYKGIGAGIMLAFARGLGEFGATLMIAGNIPGKTQTLSLAIYDAFQAGNDAKAVYLSIITSLLCLLILVSAELLISAKKKYFCKKSL